MRKTISALCLGTLLVSANGVWADSPGQDNATRSSAARQCTSATQHTPTSHADGSVITQINSTTKQAADTAKLVLSTAQQASDIAEQILSTSRQVKDITQQTAASAKQTATAVHQAVSRTQQASNTAQKLGDTTDSLSSLIPTHLPSTIKRAKEEITDINSAIQSVDQSLDKLSQVKGNVASINWLDIFYTVVPVLNRVLDHATQNNTYEQGTNNAEDAVDSPDKERDEKPHYSTYQEYEDAHRQDVPYYSSRAKYEQKNYLYTDDSVTQVPSRASIDCGDGTVWAHKSKLAIVDTERGREIAVLDLPADWLASGQPRISDGLTYGTTLYHSSGIRASVLWNVVIPLHKRCEKVTDRDILFANRLLFYSLSDELTLQRQEIECPSDIVQLAEPRRLQKKDLDSPSNAPNIKEKLQVQFADVYSQSKDGAIFVAKYCAYNSLINHDDSAYLLINVAVGDYPLGTNGDIEDMLLADKLLHSQELLEAIPDSGWKDDVTKSFEWTTPITPSFFQMRRTLNAETQVIHRNQCEEYARQDGTKILIPTTELHIWEGANGQLLQLNGENADPNKLTTLQYQEWSRVK